MLVAAVRVRAAAGGLVAVPALRALSGEMSAKLVALGVTTDERCNVPDTIAAQVGRNLHLQQNHPINIIKSIIENALQKSAKQFGQPGYKVFDRLSPLVSTKRNFDDLLTPADHVSRRPTDTYYANASTVLRTHTSAHQSQLIADGHGSFLVVADVYRRDEIDSSHYPIFHQMEGVRLFSVDAIAKNGLDRALVPKGAAGPEVKTEQPAHSKAVADFVERDLKNTVNFVLGELFQNRYPMRWVEAYFPFTRPSWEVEIEYQPNQWMEVLGCGVMQQHIIESHGKDKETVGWAFGLGLERLAMLLFEIPDIRLFWSSDPRFHDQFKSGGIVKFEPYSKYPACFKDISFWHGKQYHENDFFELVRGIGGDLVENVKLIDRFTNPKKGESSCYRILYRSMDRSLTNEEINVLQERVRTAAAKDLAVTLR